MPAKQFGFASILILIIVLIGILIGVDAVQHPQIFKSKAATSQIISSSNTHCGQYDIPQGEWCVYTYNDSKPDIILLGFDNIYHASVWYRNNKWNMVVGGWKDSKAQQWHDRIFRLETNDPAGIAGWQIVKGSEGQDYYIGNDLENAKSTSFPADVQTDVNGQKVTPYQSFHTVQPDFFPYENLPPKPDGSKWPCCDILTYSYDYEGRSPETHVGVHYLFIDNSGVIHKAGEYGDKNPLLDWHSYDKLPDPKVSGVSDARTLYDPKSKKVYMVYAEWTVGKNYDGGNALTSIAESNWDNLRYKVVKRDLLNGVFAGNPQIVIGPDNKYYLFYSRFKDGIYVAVADDILGPYIGNHLVLKPSEELPVVGTPYVFCNNVYNEWQMYFNASKSSVDNQIYTAFLHKPCSQPPVLWFVF